MAQAGEEGVRVLLVEDSDTAAEIVRRRLQEAKWPALTLHHAASLADAEPMLAQSWDVVLLDLGLPGCEGVEALGWMRARAPNLPIVVLTAQEDDLLALHALQAEAQDYLVKRQIDTDTLVRTIRYAIGRQSILGRLARAVADARESEASLRALMAKSSDGIVVIAKDDRVVFANPAAQELLQREEPELLGQPAPHIDPRKEQMEIVLAGVEPRVLDIRVVDVEWQGAHARMALLRDITGRRQGEELRVQLERAERLAAVGRLAAGVAHEINNPLTYVRINLEMALRRLASSGPEADFVLSRVVEAQDGIERVVRIVRDLRVFSRIEADPRPRPITLRDAIDSALKMAEPQLKHRARVRLSFDQVPQVLGTEGRLSQVFLNLLVNAAQAIDEGHVNANRIEIRVKLDVDDVVVEVSDTGRGIVHDHLALLFEPFFSTKKPEEGSGLGLSICRDIVKAYGGSIEAKSEVGVGTTVTVRLPAWRGREALTPSEPVHSEPVGNAKRSRVLIVDDEGAIVRALVEVLEEQYSVATACSGEEARALLETDTTFDVILCDLVMDSGTGMELYTWLVEQRPEAASRVIFMSGGGTTPEAELFLAEHVERTLTKPLFTDGLLAKVRQVATRA